jgi:hypothetical protein
MALHWTTGSRSGSKLSGWATFLALVCAFCVAWPAFRWVRIRLLWRLCNRLTVTYIFIGIIPILLLLLMAEGTVNFTPAGLTSG